MRNSTIRYNISELGVWGLIFFALAWLLASHDIGPIGCFVFVIIGMGAVGVGLAVDDDEGPDAFS